MSRLLLSRRRLVVGLVGLVAAPAVIRVAKLMPVRSIPLPRLVGLVSYGERPDDMVILAFREASAGWPSTGIGFIRHRRDLADLGEPYRALVIRRRCETGEAV